MYSINYLGRMCLPYALPLGMGRPPLKAFSSHIPLSYLSVSHLPIRRCECLFSLSLSLSLSLSDIVDYYCLRERTYMHRKLKSLIDSRVDGGVCTYVNKLRDKRTALRSRDIYPAFTNQLCTREEIAPSGMRELLQLASYLRYFLPSSPKAN